MSIANYADLLAAVAAWTNRTDLTARIPDFVTLAEARMSSDLSSKVLEREQNVPVAAGVASLPGNVIDIIGLRLADATYPDVEITSRERLKELVTRGVGQVTYGALLGRTIELSVDSGTLKVRAKCSVPPLVDGENFVIATWPNIYLFGSLLEAFDYLRDDAAVVKYQARYTEAIDQANAAWQYRGTQSYAKVRWAP